MKRYDREEQSLVDTHLVRIRNARRWPIVRVPVAKSDRPESLPHIKDDFPRRRGSREDHFPPKSEGNGEELTEWWWKEWETEAKRVSDAGSRVDGPFQALFAVIGLFLGHHLSVLHVLGW